AATSATTTDGTTVGDVCYGDVNLDNEVTMIDIVYLNKYLAGVIQFNAQQLANANCCTDNNIDTSDSNVLLKFMVHKIDSLPFEGE
ncbi:MAG: dockerin type I repeat-containing protein, partial [Ruminococcus sp.]